MDGAQDVIELMQSLGLPKPNVYKRIDGNESELERLETSPKLTQSLFHTEEGDIFTLNQPDCTISLAPVNTPGHLSDHLCFLMKESRDKSEKYSIFTGDSIIGAGSTYISYYPAYFESLIKTEKLVNELDIEFLYPAHSNTLTVKDLALNAKSKVREYIERRSEKDEKIEKTALYLSSKTNGRFTIKELYEAQQTYR